MAAPVSYEETENLKEYFRGTVGDDGLTGHAHLIRRVIFFEEAYEYLPDGTPKRRILTREDGSQTVQELPPPAVSGPLARLGAAIAQRRLLKRIITITASLFPRWH
ncbi:MAG TPA: hypothetical protein PK867_09955 [Pirellulales bacterium]|nr:hypothetical protein [Pirellulales bacterium]